MQQYWYGTLRPVFFKLTLDNVAVTGQTFAAGDVMLGIDGAAGIDISADCTETAFGYGWYKWTPSSGAHTSGMILLINVADLTVTPVFSENGIQVMTGGHIDAFLDAAGT